MKTIKYKCEVITPMFLNGAYGEHPELRGPSIKGGLRFWFRAVHAHLAVKEMKEREGRLFGDTSGRSKVLIRISGDQGLRTETHLLLPHRAGSHRASPAKAIAPGEEFELSLSFPDEEGDRVKAIFELFSMLGGVGKRVRRGMGSFRIVEANGQPYAPDAGLDYLADLIKAVSPHSKYVLNEQTLYNNFSGRGALYPWIRQVQIGSRGEQDYQALLSRIGSLTSQMKAQDANAYEASMGYASRGRFASPVYVSVAQQEGLYFPVITTLNTAPDRSRTRDIDLGLQESFKSRIL